VIVHGFVHNPAGGEVGAGFLQSNCQLALPQALIGVGFHHHKPQFASHAQAHLPFVLQRSLDGADATDLEVVRRDGLHRTNDHSTHHTVNRTVAGAASGHA
jgi:hypothetical protein